MVCIYEIRNTITDDIYIGSSVDFKNRKTRHLRDLRKGNHHSIILQRAYNKYGKENFKFKVLKTCSREQLEFYENHFLINLEPKYNICKIAYKTTGRIVTQETREKQRKYALENNVKPPEKTWKDKQVSVIMLDKDTLEKLQEFESLSSACRFLGKDSTYASTITRAIKRQINAYGYKWKYKINI